MSTTDVGDDRAYGRSLAHFPALSDAERALVDACRAGRECLVGDGRVPATRSHLVAIRAGLIRFLVLGGDSQAPVHEGGVQLRGAWFDDLLDLNDIDAARPLHLLACNIAALRAEQARLVILNLEGSTVRGGVAASSLRSANGVFMREARIFGEVGLNAADITSHLDCTNARFWNSNRKPRPGEQPADRGFALTGQSMKVSGNVDFSGARTFGTVGLIGAAIGGNLTCGGARFCNPARKWVIPDDDNGDALSLGGVKVGGLVSLGAKFVAIGQITLRGADIAGDFDCQGAALLNPDRKALSADRARIGGAFFFRDVWRVRGGIELYLMQVATLIDRDGESWPKAPAGALVLDGFSYSRIADSSTDSAMRIAWLDRQDPEHLGKDFRPQPWEQLAAVLRATGFPDEARRVAIEKQWRLLAARQRRLRAKMSLPGWVGWGSSWAYGKLVGFGYRPVRLLLIMLAVWGAFGLSYRSAAGPGDWPEQRACSLFVEAKAAAAQTPDKSLAVDRCGGTRTIDPWLYSADALLPIDLGYQSSVKPVDRGGGAALLRWLIAIETAAGWLGVALLIAAFTNLIKKD